MEMDTMTILSKTKVLYKSVDMSSIDEVLNTGTSNKHNGINAFRRIILIETRKYM